MATVSLQIEREKLNLSLQVSLQLGSKLKPQKFLYLPGTTVVPVENSRLCKDTGHGPSPSSRLIVIFVAFQLLAKHRCILSCVSSCVLCQWPPNLTDISFQDLVLNPTIGISSLAIPKQAIHLAIAIFRSRLRAVKKMHWLETLIKNADACYSFHKLQIWGFMLWIYLLFQDNSKQLFCPNW